MEKDVSRLNERRNSSFEFEKKYLDRMEKKYNLSDVGNVQVIDMLKEKISAGAKKTVLRGSYINTRPSEHCLQQTRNSFTRNLMAVVTFQIKSLMLKKLLNFGVTFGRYLDILTKMLHGSSR